ncbi:MAG TPA: hypothetical protein VF574_03870 [Allosphingosinicella sp.]|jgi:hypothetical protein
MSMLAEWPSLVAGILASVISGAASAGFRQFSIARDKAKALSAANTDDFESVLANGDLSDLGKILRDRLGTVSLEVLLNDSETQSKVFRSLQRLTEVVNQPVPEETSISTAPPAAPGEDTPAAPSSPDSYWSSDPLSPTSGPTSRDYIDLLDDDERARLAGEIARIVQAARLEIRMNDIWTGLARARRNMEIKLLPLLGGSQRSLSPRIFLSPRLRGAMGSFLGVANKAIHGGEVSFEDAERALRAAEFVAEKLPMAPVDLDKTPSATP